MTLLVFNFFKKKIVNNYKHKGLLYWNMALYLQSSINPILLNSKEKYQRTARQRVTKRRQL